MLRIIKEHNKLFMKKLLYISVLLIITTNLFAQQFPLLEGYSINPFSFSPAYAGILNNKTVFMDYRSDWSGLEGGPTTCQLSYNDKFSDKVALGGKFIYDKTDIFKQTLLMGSYSYEIKVAKDHVLNLALSAGFYRNSIDLSKYYNDPEYVQDLVLYNGQEKSKIKFATDVSVLYRYKQLEAGILFSNLMFGTVKFRDSDLAYKPLKNYQLHTSYLYSIDEKWSVKPALIMRGGQNIPAQLEIASSVFWDNRFWGTATFRTGGIFGLGFGGEVFEGILINYSYNLSSNVAINTFGSHQLTLGVKIFNFINSRKPLY